MKTKITNALFLLSFAIAGFMILPGKSMAQQQPDIQPEAKKTITIHVTSEVDGNKIVIDTTIVTDGDFDADAFLEQKGVRPGIPEDGGRMERKMIIRHQGEPGKKEFSWSDKDGQLSDTVIFDDRDISFSDKFDRSFPFPEQGRQFRYNFRMPENFPPIQGPQFDGMLEDMLRSNGLNDFTPLGEMKEVVVKKKRNGKKVVIAFEEPKDENPVKGRRHSKAEKALIYHNGEQGMVSPGDEQIIIKGEGGENMIINKRVVTDGRTKTITVTAGDAKSAPVKVKKGKKIVVIKEDESR